MWNSFQTTLDISLTSTIDFQRHCKGNIFYLIQIQFKSLQTIWGYFLYFIENSLQNFSINPQNFFRS